MEAEAATLKSLVLAGELAEPAKSHPKDENLKYFWAAWRLFFAGVFFDSWNFFKNYVFYGAEFLQVAGDVSGYAAEAGKALRDYRVAEH